MNFFQGKEIDRQLFLGYNKSIKFDKYATKEIKYMGYWNATCNITNLPICGGDKVVLIPLVKVKDECGFNVCYPTDVFVPFGFPLFGEYDEYGAIENIKTLKENEEHLLNSFNYFYKKNDGVNIRYEVIMKNNLDDFVKNVLCTRSNSYIRTNSVLHENGLVGISYMMVHAEVYHAMVNKVANYITSDNISFREKLTNDFSKEIGKCRKDFENYVNIKNEYIKKNLSSEKTEALFDMMTFEKYCNLTKTLFSIGTLNPCRVAWQEMTKKLIADDLQSLLDEVVNLHLFTKALSLSRKGYLCDSGAGSQDTETDMNYLIANFIIKHIEEKNAIDD